METGTPGEIYNLCSGHDVSLAEIVERLQVVMGTHVDLTTDPELLRPLDTPVLRGDASKIHDALGWRPTIDLAQSLSDIVAEFER
jgi:GDP-4-dehydro-6-deoxy-D-mannose reductase